MKKEEHLRPQSIEYAKHSRNSDLGKRGINKQRRKNIKNQLN